MMKKKMKRMKYLTPELMEEFRLLEKELENSELSIVKVNEKLKIHEKDIISIFVNFENKVCSF